MSNCVTHAARKATFNTAITEIESSDYLSADTISVFGDVLASNSLFVPLSPYVMGGLESVEPMPVGTRHIQIMALDCYSDRADVISHWVCTYFDGELVHVYDSLNAKSLSSMQVAFLLALYPQRPQVVFETVQGQTNGIDCGVFASAFATSIACDRNPCNEVYEVSGMRGHLSRMLRTNSLLPFPSSYKPEAHSDILQKFNIKPCVVRIRPCSPALANVKATMKKVGRPKKVKLGRPKKSALTRQEQRNVARKKYTFAHPDVCRDTAARYTQKNPQVHRDAVAKYNQENPQVHRDAVAKYSQENPQVHRDAVTKYSHENPEVNRVAVTKYRQRNPNVKEASKKNYENAHQLERTRSKRLRRAVPTELRSLANSQPIDIDIPATVSGNEQNMIPDAQVTRKSTCIADKSGIDLDGVQPIVLKKPSLNQNDAVSCPHCKAPLFVEEMGRKMWCCGDGALQIHKLPAIEADVYKNQMFLKNIRAYNNMFAFSALGTTHGFQKPATGTAFIKVQGKIYHRIFDLAYNKTVNNTALYIDDGEERMRLGRERKLDTNVIQSVERYLREVNPLIDSLRILSRHTSDQAYLVFQPTNRQRDGPILGEMPTAPEISALLRTDSECNPRKVVVWKVGESKPHNVHYLDPAYEPLQYPLLFPKATSGWSINTLDKNGKKITQLKFYRHRWLSEDRFIQLRRLGQEYIVDMWTKIEEERLQFHRHNQPSLRIANRREIDETIAADGVIPAGKVYLPSSHTHSPRYMLNKYLDSMAVVSRLGKPSFFLTVTCNPRWKEIKASLLQGQQATDRPDLCVRVFKLKLAKLLQMIRSGALFGELISIQHVIEFQKRGLPHAHIALRVSGGGPVSSLDIDAFVRATIPSVEEAGGRLRKLVLQHMVHGPCGIDNLSCPCMDKQTKMCNKKYPMQYNECTFTDEKGFVKYKRPENGQSVTLDNGKTITNQWIVPYNPAILLLMDCHCNLEIATSSKVIKYLYKYLHKGPDHAKAAVTENIRSIDEIDNYVNFRYVSSSEALWRIFEFDLCCCFPHVITLPIHLPNEDSIVFRPGEEQLATDRSVSKLQLYMDRPQIPELMNLTYLDFYEQYNMDTKSRSAATVPIIPHASGKHFITKRVREKLVARIYFIFPNAGELYFLRMLITRVACKGFEDIRTVHGVVYPTFQEAAQVHGLLNNEREYRDALAEASVFKTGRQLRQLFFVVINSGAPAFLLWEEFKDLICEDFLLRFLENPERAYAHGLCEIDRMLRMHGRCLRDMGLPEVPDDSTEVGREQLRWSETSCQSYVSQWEDQLSAEQRRTYQYVLCLITGVSNMSKVLFIDGPAGTGKTVLLNIITAKLRSLGHIVLCTASTGIASLNHQGGTTAHSMFKLPLDASANSATWGISASSERADLLRQARVIIFDEAPMANKSVLECLDRGFQDLCQSREPFGGKIVLFAGDFRQIPPIIPNGTMAEVVKASLRHSRLWPLMKKFQLTSSQRSRDDPDYASFLLKIGEGILPHLIFGDTKVIKLSGIRFETDLTSLLHTIYPQDVLQNPSECCNRAVLSGTNANIKEVNDLILDRLPGTLYHLYSADSALLSGDMDPAQHLGPEMLNIISHPGVPDHHLKIKVGSVVILIRNLSFPDGLVNGVKLIVVKVSKLLIQVRFPNSTDVHFIPRICFKFSVERSRLEMLRRQFPLKIAYGLTINKSQGQTLSCVGIDLRSDVFSHGQLYVALSRVRSRNAVRVLVSPERLKEDVAYTVNIVYKGLIE